MTGPRLRFARPADAETIAAYQTRAWQVVFEGLVEDAALAGLDPALRAADFETWLPDPPAGSTLVVAEVDGRACGHVLAVVPPDASTVGEVAQLYVDPSRWGEGIGRRLLAVGERALRRAGCTTAHLWTLGGNDRALSLYRSAGWRADGRERVDVVAGVEVPEIGMAIDLDATLDVLDANRRYWQAQAPDYVGMGERAWRADAPSWGMFGVDDGDIGFFPSVAGRDVVELGCGSAYISAWCVRAGARSVVGVDNSPAQLATARRMAVEHGVALPLVWGDAQATPFAPGSFDVAVSEYGAAIWCDPRRWIPEAARLLRPGGTLVFLGNSVLLMLCAAEFEDGPAGRALLRTYDDLGRMEWLDIEGVEYHVPHGEMIAVLSDAGFDVVSLHELRAPLGSAAELGFVDAAWAGRWPVEDLWVARRR